MREEDFSQNLRVEEFCKKFAQPRESDGYILINFIKDLRGHIARSAASDFGGTPTPHRQLYNSAAQRRISTSKQTTNKQIDASKQTNCVALNKFIY
jgi:hypothetical protein